MRVRIAHGPDYTPVELIYLLLGMGIESNTVPFTEGFARKLRSESADDVIIVLPRVGLHDLALLGELSSRCPYVMAGELGDKDRVALLAAGFKNVILYPQELRHFAGIFKQQMERQRSLMARAMSAVFRCGPVVFRPGERLLSSDSGEEIRLRAGENQILALLVLNANQALSRGAIHKSIGRSEAATGSRAIDVVVSSVRRKLVQISTPTELLSVRAEGYRLDGNWVREDDAEYADAGSPAAKG